MVPEGKGLAPQDLNGAFHMRLLIAGADVAELVLEAIVAFKLGEFYRRLLLAAGEALHRCAHIVIYHEPWDMAPEREGLDMRLHHCLLVLMSEKPAPASIAAQCSSGHVE